MPSTFTLSAPQWGVLPFSPTRNYSLPNFRDNGSLRKGTWWRFELPSDKPMTADNLHAYLKTQRSGDSWSDQMTAAVLSQFPLYVESSRDKRIRFSGMDDWNWSRGFSCWKQWVGKSVNRPIEEGDFLLVDTPDDQFRNCHKVTSVEEDHYSTKIHIGYDRCTYTDSLDLDAEFQILVKKEAAVEDSADDYLHCSHCGGEMVSLDAGYKICRSDTESDNYLCMSCISSNTGASVRRCDTCQGISTNMIGGSCEYCREKIYKCGCCSAKKNKRTDPPRFVHPHAPDIAVCPYCYARARHYDVPGHEYRPERLNFFADGGKITLGLEMEMDSADGTARDAIIPFMRDNTTLGGGKERYFIKADGSLKFGLEWVWHPHSLEALKAKQSELRKILTHLRQTGMRSHDTKTCGLHVHVGKDRLGETETYQRLALEKLIFMGDRFYNEILKFSRRNRELADTWSGQQGVASMKDACYIFQDARSDRDHRRRKGINLTNRDTVEFRFFRGTLVWKTIYATLQLVQNMVEYAKDYTVPVESVSWKMIIDKNDDKILKEYWETRKDTVVISRPGDEPVFDDENPEKD